MIASRQRSFLRGKQGAEPVVRNSIRGSGNGRVRNARQDRGIRLTAINGIGAGTPLKPAVNNDHTSTRIGDHIPNIALVALEGAIAQSVKGTQAHAPDLALRHQYQSVGPLLSDISSVSADCSVMGIEQGA